MAAGSGAGRAGPLCGPAAGRRGSSVDHGWRGRPVNGTASGVQASTLVSAVRSLLDNAAKFSPPGAPVEVRLAGGELTVRYHGPSIAPADLPHVFDRFYRAPSARGVPGSGLSIVRQVAESHGGTVRAEAAAGGGTVLRLVLPIRSELQVPQTGMHEAGAERAGRPRHHPFGDGRAMLGTEILPRLDDRGGH